MPDDLTVAQERRASYCNPSRAPRKPPVGEPWPKAAESSHVGTARDAPAENIHPAAGTPRGFLGFCPGRSALV